MLRVIIPFLIILSVREQDDLPPSQFSASLEAKDKSTLPLRELLPSALSLHNLPNLGLVSSEEGAGSPREAKYMPSIRLSFLDPQKAPLSELVAIEVKLKNKKGELWKSYVFPYAQNTRLVPLGATENFSIQLPYEVLPLLVTVDFIAGYGDKGREILALWSEPINIGTLSFNNIFYKDAAGNEKSVEAIRFTPKKILFKRPK